MAERSAGIHCGLFLFILGLVEAEADEEVVEGGLGGGGVGEGGLVAGVFEGGAFENMERANARLLVVVPITIGLIYFLLFWAFRSFRYATLIMLNLPFAMVGGVVSLWFSGQYLSVPASIGFIELFGLAVGNGIVLVSYINQLRHEGMRQDEAIVSGCSLRLRPVLMTMMTTLLGLFPLAVAQGIGAEVQRPLATVVIGGVFSSTVLTLIVLPALYQRFAEPEAEKEYAPDFV
jgi:cobalt-zinc-cadmium resistance protein CzcA